MGTGPDRPASSRVVWLTPSVKERVSIDRGTNVAHAVVMQVNLVGDAVEGMKILDEVVIPGAKALTGFQRGTWMHTSDAKTGTGVIVFDTAEHASAAMEALQPPPGGPTIIHCAVFEVAREV